MKSTKKIVLCGLFVALMAIGAFIRIPIPMLPITLQTMFVLYAAVILGGRLGAVSVLVYVIMGLIGVPVFAEGGGIWYVMKPSFGYLIGFIIGAFITGFIIEKCKKLSFGRCFAANMAGLAVVYGIGLVYFYVISNYVIEAPIAVWPLFLHCFLLTLPGDICISVIVAATTKRIKGAVEKI
jgi:biotin transport system substrate-specific component